MCNFHTCDVWNYLKDYDVVLRVDEDCILSGDWSDVFDGELDYRTPMFDIETHELTNKTLPEWLGEDAKYYDRTMPYTNIFVSRTKPWFREDVQAWIDKVRKSQGCFKYRWGDHVLHGVILKKFGISNGTVPLSYYHGSHNRHIN